MILPIIFLLALIALNGFLAMAELAMMTSQRTRLEQSARRGSLGAGVALALAREPTKFLSTVQVGITLIGILAGAFGEASLANVVAEQIGRVQWLEPYKHAIALAFVVLTITYCSLVIGELVPKRIALAHPEAIASAIAIPLRTLSVAAAWPVRLLTGSTEAILRVLRVRVRDHDEVSEDDVRALMARAAGTGIFTPQEHRLMERTMRAAHLTVRDLMVPRREIVWIDEGESLSGVRVIVGTNPHSHFPLCRGGLDQLVGVVHIKDLIAYGLLAGDQFRPTEVAHKPLFVPENMPALRLLDQFRASRTHIAIVVDEHGGTQGLLTINDVTSAIVGDIARKGEPPAPTASRRADGSWLVDGRVPLHELAVTLEILHEAETRAPRVSTAGGLVAALLGHIPREGESVLWEGWRLEVLDMDGSRIDKVLAQRT
ncbi:MAG: hemolysin family protein [Phycisphaerales bacterium]